MRIGYIEIRVYTDDIYSNEGLRGAKQKLISDKRKSRGVDNQTQLTNDNAQISEMVCTHNFKGMQSHHPATSLYMIEPSSWSVTFPTRMLTRARPHGPDAF